MSERPDQGESTVQLVILTPLLLLLVVLGVQTAVYFHAANVATAAAAQGAATGSSAGGGDNAAVRRAVAVVADLDGHLAAPPNVGSSGDFVVVTVEMAVPTLVPFFPSSVKRTAREPRERFVPESER